MKYRVEQIEERVYALLDENKELNEERVDYCDPGASLTALIRGFLAETARKAVMDAPLTDIDECVRCKALNPQYYPDSRKATLRLPADFLRLVYLRMSDWENGIDTPLDTSGEEYRLRSSSGSRGFRRTYPAVAVRSRGLSRTLEIFGTRAGSSIADLDYVAVPVLADGEIDLPPGLFPEVCARLAETIRKIMT